MDSIGGMLNPFGKMLKTHYKNEFCNGFTGKKLMVYNGVLMETIGISVMASIVFLAGHYQEVVATGTCLIVKPYDRISVNLLILTVYCFLS